MGGSRNYRMKKKRELETKFGGIKEEIDQFRKLKQIYNNAESEFNKQTADTQKQIQDIKNQLWGSVVGAGESIKGDGITAVYAKPQTIWDDKGLQQYAKDHPEVADAINSARKTTPFTSYYLKKDWPPKIDKQKPPKNISVMPDSQVQDLLKKLVPLKTQQKAAEQAFKQSMSNTTSQMDALRAKMNGVFLDNAGVNKVGGLVVNTDERVTYDKSIMNQLVQQYPELAKFGKESQPSVSFKLSKKK